MKGKIDTRKPDIVLFQTSGEDDVPEPPILLKRYTGIIEFSQGNGNEIMVNPGSVPDLIRALKELIPEPSKK